MKTWAFTASKGRTNILKLARILRMAESALPIIREVRTMINDDFSWTKFIVVKKNTQRSTTGVDCKIASCTELEKKVERIRATANKRTGIFNGFVTTVILFSTTTFTPHNTKRRRLPNTMRICFGKVKKSVVMVRKKRGKRR